MSNVQRLRCPSSITRQGFARQPLVRLAVAAGRPRDHLAGQRGRRRLLIPARTLQPIPDVLLVEAWRRATRRVVSDRPEARGVWGQQLVNQDELAIEQAKLHLGVGD